MKVLYLIPARGDSKSIPGKNIKELNGKRLIYYTIDAAREISDDQHICVSTDSDLIAEIVEEYGLKVPFLRPVEISADNSPTSDVIKHAYNYYLANGIDYDLIALLQPTSPFRNGRHIQEALNMFHLDLDLVVSMYKTKANPYFVLFEKDDRGLLVKSKKGNFTRRQDCPRVYQLNGAIYLLNAKAIDRFSNNMLENVKGYEMEEIFSIDIDNYLDWQFAEFLLQKGLV